MHCCILRRPSADLLQCLSILISVCNLLAVRLLVTAALLILINTDVFFLLLICFNNNNNNNHDNVYVAVIMT